MVRRPADFSASVSVISRIETFGYPQITPAETKGREALSKTLPELPLSGLIASRAIFLRQQGNMGWPMRSSRGQRSGVGCRR